MRETGAPSGRLLSASADRGSTAHRLYELTRSMPIISPHGHVDPGMLAENRPFSDPASLLIRDDHYVARLLHADGLGLDELRIGEGEIDEQSARSVWRAFSERWHLFAGTASGYWMRSTFQDVLGIDEAPSAQNADRIFDTVVELLARPEMHPQPLLERFGIVELATTDDPLDSLEHHRAIAADDRIATRVRPTFRPDAYLDPSTPGWSDRVERLLASSRGAGYRGYVDALQMHRERFIAAGAISADFGVVSARTVQLDEQEASELFDRARRGELDPAERATFLGHMLVESARMSVEDGLVMTIHAGVHRNHHLPTQQRFGADRGADIPVATEWVRGLEPLLSRFGTAPGFHLVLFTVDETTFSREIAPLAGFYPSVFVGAPWWFLDAPDAARRFREATVETAGFYRGSGFIDDTRAFLSIPARHDMARRVDAGFLARLVDEERISLDEAERIAVDLVDAVPRRAFKL